MARSVRDEAIITLRATGADVLVIAIDVRTGRYTFTSHLRGLRARVACQATSEAT